MKKLLTSFLFISSVVAVQAAANKMSMVTYFPVPYVAYNKVKVKSGGELDIGLSANACLLELGCTSTTNQALKTDNLHLTSGTLALEPGTDQKIFNTTTIIGSGSADAKVFFNGTGHRLTINNTTLGARTLNNGTLNVTSLTLFGKLFPNCKEAFTGSNGQMQWTALALGPNKETKEIYLQCGGAQEVPTEECTPGETQTERCDDFYVDLPRRRFEFPNSPTYHKSHIQNVKRERICNSQGKWNGWSKCYANVWAYLGTWEHGTDVSRDGFCHKGIPLSSTGSLYFYYSGGGTYDGGDQHGDLLGCIGSPQTTLINSGSYQNYNTENEWVAGKPEHSVCSVYQCKKVTPSGYDGGGW